MQGGERSRAAASQPAVQSCAASALLAAVARDRTARRCIDDEQKVPECARAAGRGMRHDGPRARRDPPRDAHPRGGSTRFARRLRRRRQSDAPHEPPVERAVPATPEARDRVVVVHAACHVLDRVDAVEQRPEPREAPDDQELEPHRVERHVAARRRCAARLRDVGRGGGRRGGVLE